MGCCVSQAIHALGGQGALTDSDLEDFNEAEARVYNLMKDRRWHSASEIVEVSGQREGLRRLRELRSSGIQILKSRPRKRKGLNQSREFWYLVILKGQPLSSDPMSGSLPTKKYGLTSKPKNAVSVGPLSSTRNSTTPRVEERGYEQVLL